MKKIIGLAACLAVAACACDENQWEEVDNVTFDETVYEEPAPVEAQPVYIPAPQPVYDAPCAEVQAQPCCNNVYVQPCMQSCGCQQVVAPQPKVTKTRKIITTTTTYEEPCGKDVCEPIVTTHEEIVPVEEDIVIAPVTTQEVIVAPKADAIVPAAAEVKATVPAEEGQYIDVKVKANPYESEVVEMKSSSAKAGMAIAQKYSPEVYNVVATRATNRMLQDTSAIYDNGQTKTVYIKETELLSTDLPYGSHRLRGATKDLISGSHTFDIVNNATNADFIIETSADWYVSSDNKVPALQYKLTLVDKDGKKVNDWIEVIRQVQE